MPPTCPGALTLPSTASSSAEGSPSPPSPPSHCGLPPKSLGASVRKNRWRGKMTASAKRKQKAGNRMKGLYSINISRTFIRQAGCFLTALLHFSMSLPGYSCCYSKHRVQQMQLPQLHLYSGLHTSSTCITST